MSDYVVGHEFSFPAAAGNAVGIWLTCGTEHARLKEHVTSMTGGLEAKIQEGYVSFLSHFAYNLSVPKPSPRCLLENLTPHWSGKQSMCPRNLHMLFS